MSPSCKQDALLLYSEQIYEIYEEKESRYMNILVVHNYYRFPGGEDTVVKNEIEMLKQHGHKVYTYIRSNKEIDDYNIIQKAFLPVNTIFSFKSYKEVKRIIKKKKIDIVHVHNTLTQVSPAVYYAAFKMNVPVVQTMHNFRFLCPAATFYRDGHVCEKCLNKGLKCAIAHRCYRGSLAQTFVSTVMLAVHRMLGTYKRISYISLTDFNKEKLLKLEGIKNHHIYIKPNFVDDPDIEKRSTRKDYYLYVGRLEKLKGIDKLLKAWTLFNDEGKAPKLVICGTGDMDKKCQQFVQSNNLDSVELKGFVDADTVRRLMEGAKALIFPSQCYETFGMSIAESYSVHTPVLASNLGNASNLVIEGVTGFHFKHNDPKDICRVIRKYEAISVKDRKNIRDNAYNEYLLKYTKEANYEKLIEIYENVIFKNKK